MSSDPAPAPRPRGTQSFTCTEDTLTQLEGSKTTEADEPPGYGRLKGLVATMVRRRNAERYRLWRRAAERDAEYLRERMASVHTWMDPEAQWIERECDELYAKTLASLPPQVPRGVRRRPGRRTVLRRGGQRAGHLGQNGRQAHLARAAGVSPCVARVWHHSAAREAREEKSNRVHTRRVASQGCSACVAASASRSHWRCSGVMSPIAAAKSASSFGSDPLDLYRSTTSGARRGSPRPIAKHPVDRAPDARIAAKHPLFARAIPLVQQELEVKAVGPGHVHLVNRQLQPFARLPMARAAHRRLFLRECRAGARAGEPDRRVEPRRRCPRADASGARRRGRSPNRRRSPIDRQSRA